MPTPSPRAQVILDRLEGVVALDLEVREATDVLDDLRSLRCAGDLEAFHPLPGQDLMIPVPGPRGAPRWRRYTVRAIDRAAGTLELWVTTGSSGPGAAWALACAPGDTFEAVGPRGKVRVDDTVPSHLLVVDTSGLSAALAMQAAIHPPSTVSVAALVERVPGAAALRGLAVHAQPAPAFLTSLDDLVGHLERLLGADRGTDPGADPRSTAAYVFGELSFTRLVRDRLVELGIPGARVAAKAYWRAGQSNQDHGEPDKTPA